MTLENDFERYMRSVLDSGHESRPGADAPPANTWEQVLAKVQPLDEEGDDMTATILTTDASRSPGFPSRHGVYPRVPPKKSSRGFGHYLNLAATIAIVVAVAVAGWFATMQLNQSGDPEPRLAILNATPEASPESASATCDVEPLSTDRVMEIVKNPARFMAEGATVEALETPMTGSPGNADLWEVDPDLEIVGESTTPSEDHFDEASLVANEYLNCLVYGTQAQVWTFYSPVLLQQKILAEFPVFAEESQVRERVEELSAQPAYEAELAWVQALSARSDSPNVFPDEARGLELDPEIGSVTVNPDFQLSRVHQSESSYYTQVLSIGISIEDKNGNQMILTNGVGNSIVPVDPFGSGMNAPMLYVQVAKLRGSNGWVIIPWPSMSELGWDLYD